MRYEPGVFITKYFDELGSKAQDSSAHISQNLAVSAGELFQRRQVGFSYVVLRVINNSKVSNEKY